MQVKIRQSGFTWAIFLLITAAVMPAAAATKEDNDALARRYLRCAAFYVFGSTGVTKPELKQQLEYRANFSLYSAEILMEGERPRVKQEYEVAREKFLAETLSDEVKADTRGFLQYMGKHCNELQKNHPVKIPKKATS